MSEQYESHERHQFANGRDLLDRVTRLETRFEIMDKGFERLAEAMESTSKDIHGIREIIATGKGAWWGAGLVIGALMALAGALGAAIHKMLPP